MVPNQIIPQVVREKIIVQSPKIQGLKLKKRRIIDSDDEDEEVVLSDKDEQEEEETQQIVNIEEEIEIVEDDFVPLGGEDIYEPIADYSAVDNTPDHYRTTSSSGMSNTKRYTETDNFDITKYRSEMKEKSKDAFKTNGHMDLDKILKLSINNEVSSTRRIKSLPSLIFSDVPPPKWASSSNTPNDLEDDDIIIDFSLDDLQSSSSPPNKSIPPNFGSKKVKLNDFYD